MILPDVTLERMIKEGELISTPIEEYQIQPASVDLRLGNEFKRLVPNTCNQETCDGNMPDGADHCGGRIDFRKKINYISDEKQIIYPGEFLLGTTVEKLKLPRNIGAMISGRSSVGRTGLVVENAGWVDPGFEGKITLELFNMGNAPIVKPYGLRICQVIFFNLSRSSFSPYGVKDSKYQNQDTVVGSKVYLDEEIR